MSTRPNYSTLQPSSLSRYTRFVHSTKMGLGIVAMLLVGILLFYPLLREQNSGGVRILLNTSEKKDPEPAVMKTPRFHGLDKNNQPYMLSADTATETAAEMVLLVNPSAEMVTQDAQRLYMKARDGTYDKKQHTLLLKGAIEMMDDRGYRMQTEVMHIDLANKLAITADLVSGQGELGTLKAYGGAQADGKTQRIFFDGPIFMTLKMDHKTLNGQAPASKQEKPQ